MTKTRPIPFKKRPLEVNPCSQPYAHVVRFKNGRANLLKTFISLAKGQDLLIRLPLKTDRLKVQGTANSAGLRIRIEEHPALNTIRVVSLGPQRERVMTEPSPDGSSPRRVRYFNLRRDPPQRKKAANNTQASKPTQAAKPSIDIFS